MNKKYQALEMMKRGWITPLDSWRLIGLHALGQRVTDLKKEGHKIASERVQGQPYNRYRVIA